MTIRDKIYKFISYLLPNRLVYWVIIRAFAYTTVHSHPDKTPDEVGFAMLCKSWETKTELKVTDMGVVKEFTVDHPNL